MAETPSVGHAVQRSENPRKNSFLNYESPALTAELQASLKRNAHRTCRATNYLANTWQIDPVLDAFPCVIIRKH